MIPVRPPRSRLQPHLRQLRLSSEYQLLSTAMWCKMYVNMKVYTCMPPVCRLLPFRLSFGPAIYPRFSPLPQWPSTGKVWPMNLVESFGLRQPEGALLDIQEQHLVSEPKPPRSYVPVRCHLSAHIVTIGRLNSISFEQRGDPFAYVDIEFNRSRSVTLHLGGPLENRILYSKTQPSACKGSRSSWEALRSRHHKVDAMRHQQAWTVVVTLSEMTSDAITERQNMLFQDRNRSTQW